MHFRLAGCYLFRFGASGLPVEVAGSLTWPLREDFCILSVRRTISC